MKKCLIVVDYQKDFVDGSLGFDKAVKLENGIVSKIKEYREKNDDVIFTFDTHEENYMNTREGKYLPIPHCIKGTSGHELYGKIKDCKLDKDIVFNKPAFGSADLFDYIRNSNYDSIELVGIVSNICVISNAIVVKTAKPEIDIIVDSKCVASNDDSLNEAALKVMESMQIIIK